MSKSKKSYNPDEYSVGYKTPPKHSQFKKGKSGNPKGRPPTKAIHNMFEEVMNDPVMMKIGEESIKMTQKEAMIRQLMNQASKGNMSAMKLVIKLLKDLREIPPF